MNTGEVTKSEASQELPVGVGESGTGDGGNRAVWYIAFMVLMISIAAICITLFARALFRPQLRYPNEIHLESLRIPDRILVVFIVGLISLVPLLLLGRQLLRAHKEPSKTDPIETLLHLSVHAVPYGILSLSMLFEYHKIIEGKAEGAAALASIMILFILSELGLILFTEVREAKWVSRDLAKVLSKVHDTQDSLDTSLKGMTWLRAHAEITHASSAAPKFVEDIEELLSEWRRLLAPPADFRHLLMNLLLCKYLREEVKDISGDVKSTRLPEGIKLPGSSHYHRVSIFATNIDLYACFLEQAVEELSKKIGGRLNPHRRACIVAVTTALPTQFWNWPHNEGRKAVEYKPVSDYREAQFQAVEAGLTRIFRTVLVADAVADNADAVADVSGAAGATSEELSVLRPGSEWQVQKNWLFILQGGKPLTRRDMRFPFDIRFLAPSLSWTKGDMIDDSIPGGAYWMAKEELKDWMSKEKDVGEHGKYPFELMSVWDFYCCNMHGLGAADGRTEVVPVSEGVFNEEWGVGFAGCRDLMLLGTCTSKEDNVWEDNGVEWGIALMTSMSTRTETMFLVVMHESRYIQEIWRNLLDARRRLDSEKTLSDSRSSKGRQVASSKGV